MFSSLGELIDFDLDVPARSKPARPAGCCATSAHTSSKKCCGCSVRQRGSTPTSIMSTARRGAPMPASSSTSLTAAVSTRASPRASSVSRSKVNHLEGRRLRAFGSLGADLADGADVQAQTLFAGTRPLDDPAGWGYERRERWGVLHTAEGAETVPPQRGAYQDYYTEFTTAVAATASNRCLPAPRSAPSRCWRRRVRPRGSAARSSCGPPTDR